MPYLIPIFRNDIPSKWSVIRSLSLYLEFKIWIEKYFLHDLHRERIEEGILVLRIISLVERQCGHLYFFIWGIFINYAVC